MLIRPALPSDLEALVTLGRQTFTDAFGAMYSADDLAAFLDDWRSPERIAANIADDAIGVTVADDDGRLVGYCTTVFGKGFAERPEPQPRNPAFLSQLYCASDATGRGIGAALIEQAIAEAKRRGCDAMQLSVWSGNTRAQAFYRGYGFAKVADIDFWVGNHRDDEFLYELAL
jgi:ribosomal protein S18 acetylase RimI-like enzyme